MHCIVLQFWGSEVQNGFTSLKPTGLYYFWRLQGRIGFLVIPSFQGCSHCSQPFSLSSKSTMQHLQSSVCPLLVWSCLFFFFCCQTFLCVSLISTHIIALYSTGSSPHLKILIHNFKILSAISGNMCRSQELESRHFWGQLFNLP